MRCVKEKVIGSEDDVDNDDLTIEDVKIIFLRESPIRLSVPHNGIFRGNDT